MDSKEFKVLPVKRTIAEKIKKLANEKGMKLYSLATEILEKYIKKQTDLRGK